MTKFTVTPQAAITLDEMTAREQFPGLSAGIIISTIKYIMINLLFFQPICIPHKNSTVITCCVAMQKLACISEHTITIFKVSTLLLL